MLLELLDLETQIRVRQSQVRHDLQMLNLKPAPGPVRRGFGTLLIRFGESMRGTSARNLAQPVSTETLTGAMNA